MIQRLLRTDDRENDQEDDAADRDGGKDRLLVVTHIPTRRHQTREYIYIYMYICMHIYIYRERDR